MVFFVQGKLRAVIVGLTSRGSAVCGEMHTPAIYTRIKSHLSWIEAVISASAPSVWHRFSRNVASWMLVMSVMVVACTRTS